MPKPGPKRVVVESREARLQKLKQAAESKQLEVLEPASVKTARRPMSGGRKRSMPGMSKKGDARRKAAATATADDAAAATRLGLFGHGPVMVPPAPPPVVDDDTVWLCRGDDGWHRIGNDAVQQALEQADAKAKSESEALDAVRAELAAAEERYATADTKCKTFESELEEREAEMKELA